MGVKIIQTCDGCGVERELSVGGFYEQYPNIEEAANAEGWRVVIANKSLCKGCIKNALNN